MRAAARLLFVALLAGALAVVPTALPALAADSGGEIVVTVPDHGQPAGDAITDAQFRWGLNAEAGSGAFAGGCNFLSAGRSGDVGRGGVVWTEEHGLYRAVDGDVRIEKPRGVGEYDVATWADRCRDAEGREVTASSLSSQSGNQVVIEGGAGRRASDGSLEIRWTGSFTVVFYGGMTYWSASDPVLSIDAAGNGRVTATASGFGASMTDITRWEPLPERQVVLAELRGVDTSADAGFATDPLYRGVEVPDAGQTARSPQNDAHWGSFPASFVHYQKLTGQAGYWLTTGGQRDPAKVASTLYISYDADDALAVTPPRPAGGEENSPRNVVRQRPLAAALASDGEPVLPMFPVADTATLLPQSEGLVPGGPLGFASPLVLPLLGTAMALSAGILAVLNLMQALPWQRASRRP
ncbi:hypothetical protein ACTU3I_01300 [Microbacterium sp. RD1]|uniref:hypothetical protein n=1 Tax=Microbacterium sp. RD1 TaxID=3457313 RepID=UPI003FA57AC8